MFNKIRNIIFTFSFAFVSSCGVTEYITNSEDSAPELNADLDLELKSAEDDRVSKIVSWASPSDFINRLPDKEKRKNWQRTNIAYVYNGRTKQNMPMYYQFYENCMANLDRLNIKKVLQSLKIPHLHVHGSSDKSVLIDEAYQIKKWNKATFLHIIKEANHVFGSFHPYNLMSFPKDLKNAIDFTISFLKT